MTSSCASSATSSRSPRNEPDDGPEINDISQLLDAVTIGHAVAYVPVRPAAGSVSCATMQLS